MEQRQRRDFLDLSRKIYFDGCLIIWIFQLDQLKVGANYLWLHKSCLLAETMPKAFLSVGEYLNNISNTIFSSCVKSSSFFLSAHIAPFNFLYSSSVNSFCKRFNSFLRTVSIHFL